MGISAKFKTLKNLKLTTSLVVFIALPVALAYSQTLDWRTGPTNYDLAVEFVGPVLPALNEKTVLAELTLRAPGRPSGLQYLQKISTEPELPLPVIRDELQNIEVAENVTETGFDLPGNCETVEPQFVDFCNQIQNKNDIELLSQPKHTLDIASSPVLVERQEITDLTVLPEEEPAFVPLTSIAPQIPPVPRPRTSRPVLYVHPISVANVQPARSISGDPLVNASVPGSWPRRLDKVNALAGAQDIMVARRQDKLIFLHDWVEVRMGDLVVVQLE